MIDLNDYFYYVHVVDKQGFSAAAKALNMPKSRLSRHVAKLEQRLDVQLIQRTSRQFNVTETGMIFYQHAKNLVEEMETAEATMQKRKGVVSGKVTLSCSVGLAQFALKDLIIEFLIQYPDIELIQQVTNQTIDMVSSGIDLAIRGHTSPLPDSNIIQRNLANVTWHLFASPNYLSLNGTPKTPNDLFKQQGLKMGWQPSSGHWNVQNETGSKEVIPFTPRLCSDDMNTLKQAAADGMGIVSLPNYICKEELASGTLVRILPSWVTGEAQLSLLMPSRRAQSSAVHVLSEYLIKNLRHHTE